MKKSILILLAFCCLKPLRAELEVFAKASASRSYVSEDKWTVSVSGTAGFALAVISRIRIEARYTNIYSHQNKMDFSTVSVTGTLRDIKTRTDIYSLGLDIDLLGPKSVFQPFIFLGVGYLMTERNFDFVDSLGVTTHISDPKRWGLSGNAGAGFRVRIAKSFAFEVEAFAYSVDIDKPNPLINLYGTAGVRIYI